MRTRPAQLAAGGPLGHWPVAGSCTAITESRTKLDASSRSIGAQRGPKKKCCILTTAIVD
jgi:hypothetical protein